MRLREELLLETESILFRRSCIPYRDHVVVNLLQFLLGGLHGVWRGVELVGLEALIREANCERLIILLMPAHAH